MKHSTDTLKMLWETKQETAKRDKLTEAWHIIFIYGLMYDALHELANLSHQLQAHSITLMRADQLLKCTIRVLASFKDGTFWNGSPAVNYKAHTNQCEAVPTTWRSTSHLKVKCFMDLRVVDTGN